MLSAKEYTCTSSSLRQVLHSWLTNRSKTKQMGWVSQETQQEPSSIGFTAWILMRAVCYRRSSGHGWGLVCGTPWLPKWHSQPGLSLARQQSRASSDVFCRTAWGSSSALFYCLLAPGKGSNGQSPPKSLLTHQESMFLSNAWTSNIMLQPHKARVIWTWEWNHTWSEEVLVKFVPLVSHNPCRRMGFHKGEDWTWDIFPGGSSLTVRISAEGGTHTFKHFSEWYLSVRV